MNDPLPATKKEAVSKIILGELTDLFGKVETLREAILAVDRTVQVSTKALKSAAAAMPDKPIPMIEPKRANPLIVAAVAAVVGGLVAGAVVVGGVALLSHGQEEARVGRAVIAVFPTLDATTQQKLQAAIDKAPH